MSPVATALLRTDRLVLSPLREADAVEMVGVLSDSDLYVFTGGSPPRLADLESQYEAQVAGPSSGEEVWHNWIIRPNEIGKPVGFVQATVTGASSDVAWVIGVDWQGQGFASEAASAMCDWLATQGVEQFTAHIHPGHVASQRVAASLGMQATDEVDSDGEVVWRSLVGTPQ
jgi:RimJ/RimL family protein N-acetyltransferase